MSAKEIADPDNLREKYKGVISLLRFFIDDRRYGVVDRLAFALSPESAETSILEALRIINSLRERSIRAKMRRGGNEKEKEYTVICCDYGEGEGPGILGVFVEAEREELKNKLGYCVPCPLTPSEEELNNLIMDLRNDLTIGRRLAILAYGLREKREEVEE